MKKINFKLILQIIFGGTFIFSAYSKIISPGLFEILLLDSGFFSSRLPAAYFTRLLIGFELALGLLIFQPNYLKKIVLPVAIALLVGFTLYLGYTGLILGDKENCGCFGELIEMTPVESIFKNLVFLIVAIFLYRSVKTKKTNTVLPVSLTVASFIFVFLIAPMTNVKDFKFSKFTHFESYGRVDLAKGDILLAVFNLDCDHCREAAADVWELQEQNLNIPEMFVLFYQEGDLTVDFFNETTGTMFPFAIIDENTFFDLIGNSPPRIYWLQEGNVKEIWDDNFIENMEKSFL